MPEQVDLSPLVQWDSRPQPTLSLYLALDASRERRLAALNLLIKTKGQELKARGGETVWLALAPDLEQVTHLIEELPLGPHRGLAAFSCQGEARFVHHLLPLPVANLLKLGPRPYLRPLAALTGDLLPSLTVLTDQRRARFFSGALGQLEELKSLELVSEAAPPPRDGDSGRAGDQHRRAGEAKSRHAKETAARMLDHCRASGCEQVFLAGPRQAVEALEASLHPYLGERLAGVLSLEIGASPPTVNEAVTAAQGQARRERQERTLARLGESLGPGGQAVAGLDQVLAVLQGGQVRALLIDRDYAEPGGSCPACGRLDSHQGPCPHCGTPVTPVDDVINLAAIRALESGAALEQVASPSPLDELGRIAALLRYA